MRIANYDGLLADGALFFHLEMSGYAGWAESTSESIQLSAPTPPTLPNFVTRTFIRTLILTTATTPPPSLACTADNPPVVTSISPNMGNGGERIIIKGKWLYGKSYKVLRARCEFAKVNDGYPEVSAPRLSADADFLDDEHLACMIPATGEKIPATDEAAMSPKEGDTVAVRIGIYDERGPNGPNDEASTVQSDNQQTLVLPRSCPRTLMKGGRGGGNPFGPMVSARSSSLLLSGFADARSSDDVIAFEGLLQRLLHLNLHLQASGSVA